MTYRLFVSHSSPSPEARARLAAFTSALETAAADGVGAGRLRVLYDKEQITSGDDWRRRIAFMLHACNGGVVLLDDAALQSPWVLAEATFLSLRQEYDAMFGCFPVSFLDQAGLDQRLSVLEALRDPEAGRMASWKVVDLPAIQFAEGVSVDALAGRVVAALRDRGDLAGRESSADRLGGQLAPYLAGGSEAILGELAEQLRGRAPYLTSDGRTLAALAIVQKVLDTGRLLDARAMLDELGTAFPNECRQTIITELLPLQLRADSSALFRRRRPGGGLTHTGLCCDVPQFTIPAYLRRAYLTRVPPALIAVPNDHGGFDELRSALRDEWRARSESVLGPPTDEEVDRELADPDQDVYVSVAGPVDESVMAQLDRAYPRVAFIVHHSREGAELPLPPQLLPILPDLAIYETRIIKDFEKAWKVWRANDPWQR